MVVGGLSDMWHDLVICVHIHFKMIRINYFHALWHKQSTISRRVLFPNTMPMIVLEKPE